MPENTKVSNGSELTPELVKKVAERVYAMLLADLKRERERSGRTTRAKQKRLKV